MRCGQSQIMYWCHWYHQCMVQTWRFLCVSLVRCGQKRTNRKTSIFMSFTEEASWAHLSLNKCRTGSRLPSSCYCMLFIERSRITFIKIKPLALNTTKLLISTLPNQNSVASVSHHCNFLASILKLLSSEGGSLGSSYKSDASSTNRSTVRCLIAPRQQLYLIWRLFHLL
jgi:hypothetical protein